MTHYQKLTTIFFRIFGAIFMIAGALIGLISLIASLVAVKINAIILIVFYALPLIVFGGLFFGASKLLAKWICFDLDKSDEQK